VARLVTDARPDGRKSAAGNRDDPRDEPVTGYLDARYETLPAQAPFDEVREALRRAGFVIVLSREGERPLGVVTPEGALQRVSAT
ncbi:MAG TPA: hypothetical protein VNZ52_08205, partial [Candidatus Thermoplasmatota archaeon]|nr:hypothetical protein [Candidatus Thermoplasmatota archaeon]